MKGTFLVLFITILGFTSCNKVPGTGKPDLKNEVDSISYALGTVVANGFIKQLDQSKGMFDTIDTKQIARAFAKSELQESYLKHIKNQLDTIDADLFKKGYLNQLVYGKNGVFGEMMADVVLRQKNDEVRARKQKEMELKTVANLEEGAKFLFDNKTKVGVVETESGLQYKVLVEGKGVMPSSTDKVKCIYHGTLLDGTVFDSSKEKGDTATFSVSGVIQGWQEALPMMKEGSKWELYVPSDLAYGVRGNRNIEPNSTLIFEIELISVVK